MLYYNHQIRKEESDVNDQSVLDVLEKVAVILASIATIAKVMHDWKK